MLRTFQTKIQIKYEKKEHMKISKFRFNLKHDEIQKVPFEIKSSAAAPQQYPNNLSTSMSRPTFHQ